MIILSFEHLGFFLLVKFRTHLSECDNFDIRTDETVKDYLGIFILLDDGSVDSTMQRFGFAEDMYLGFDLLCSCDFLAPITDKRNFVISVGPSFFFFGCVVILEKAYVRNLSVQKCCCYCSL